jgi:PAS domain S-box-containing protein
LKDSSDRREPPEVILVVDDDFDNAQCFAAILENDGYETLIADNGSEAVSIAASGKVDLVLMDIIMAGIDGVTAAGMIKANVGPEDFLPVALVTAFHDEKTKIQGLTHADAYIAKPVSNTEIVAIVRSLLKIRRLTRELAKTRDTYKRFYENIPLMYVTVRRDGLIVSSNKSFADIFQISKGDSEAKNIRSFLRSDDNAAFSLFLESVINTDPVPQQGVFEFAGPFSPSGRAAHMVSVRASAQTDGYQEKLVSLLMEDVTDRLTLEEERKTARKQLYRSAHFASIGTLASGVAHEMNNPLTAILGFSSALLSRAGNNEEIEKNELVSYLQIINNEAIRCRDIVEHLHKFARDSGEVHITRISLAECIRSALHLITMKAARSEITIVNELGDDVQVLADANRLEQVFFNLLTNGIDFCGPGDTVTIAKATGKKASKYARILVSDNGPGMTPDVLAKAFDPFFTTKEVGKGVGMGLAVCYKIMDELNGRIDIASETGKGTAVTVEIPMAQ